MLKDIGERISVVLPRYGRAVLAILSAPISETTQRAARGDLVTDALAFWAISVAIDAMVRLLTFDMAVDNTRFVLAMALQNLSTLVACAVAFSLATRIAGRPVPLRHVLIAVALLWAAVLPVLTFVQGTIYVTILANAPQLFEAIGAFLFSCSGGADIPEAARALPAILRDGPASAQILLAVQMILSLAILGVSVAYSLAFVRVLGRLGHASGGRLVIVTVIGALLFVIGLAAASSFGWLVGRGISACT